MPLIPNTFCSVAYLFMEIQRFENLKTDHSNSTLDFFFISTPRLKTSTLLNDVIT